MQESPAEVFPRARGRAVGYRPADVDEVVEHARRTLDNELGAGESALRADELSVVGFRVARGGYLAARVDAAMDRIEDELARRELAESGKTRAALEEEAMDTAQVILNRLVRPTGHRFRRAVWPRMGYSIREVDRLSRRIAGYLGGIGTLTGSAIREATFAPQRGGYYEPQVDAVFDATVRVLRVVDDPT